MACGMLKPRYWPGLENEPPVETEEGAGDAVVVADEASLLSPLDMAGLLPLIAPPEGGVGDIDVDAMAAVAATPTGGAVPPAAIGADEAAVASPAGGGGDGAALPPAAREANTPSPTPLNDAAAKLASADSRVFRDVAMFMRIWPAPPYP